MRHGPLIPTRYVSLANSKKRRRYGVLGVSVPYILGGAGPCAKLDIAKNLSRRNDDRFFYPSQKLISRSKPKAAEVHRGSLPPKPTQPFQAKPQRCTDVPRPQN